MNTRNFLPGDLDKAEALDIRIRQRLRTMHTAMDAGRLEDVQHDALTIVQEIQEIIFLQAKRHYQNKLKNLGDNNQALHVVKKMVEELEKENGNKSSNSTY